MKQKILFTVCVSFICIYSQAQSSKATFGFTAGATIASYKVKVQSISVTSDSKTGFTAGVMASLDLGKRFYFQPGLNFTQKGGILKDASNGTKDNSRFNYLELPLNFIYDFHSSKGKVFIGAGPSVAIGFGGKYKVTGMYDESGKIKFGNSTDDDLKAMDIGANVLAGYQFANGLFFAASYNFGLSNIAPKNSSSQEKSTIHNNYIGIKIGYLFLSKVK